MAMDSSIVIIAPQLEISSLKFLLYLSTDDTFRNGRTECKSGFYICYNTDSLQAQQANPHTKPIETQA